MAYVPLAQEFNAIYTLTSADGDVAVLNDTTSGNYVGAVTEMSGLDSADVRESADEHVEADGGQHGNFYFGRRPITFTIRVFGHATTLERATRIDRLRRATTALRADAQLTWSPIDFPGTTLNVPFRRQQPIRETGAWVKEIQVALVSELAVIRSNTDNTSASTASGTGVVVENKGNYSAYPTLRITGASTNPSVTDGHGGNFKTTGLSAGTALAAGETLEIDTLKHTAKFTAGARNGQSANKYIDWATTIWPFLKKGNNTFTLSGGGSLVVVWRDTWA